MMLAEKVVEASSLQKEGAFAFGLVIGWYVYYINRYRKEVKIEDLTTVIGAVGGGAVLALFPAKSDLFACYGTGLATGFFLYFFILLAFALVSPNFGIDFFLDGRRKLPDGTTGWPPDSVVQRAMAGDAGLPPGA